jgi:hypothetical protein
MWYNGSGFLEDPTEARSEQLIEDLSQRLARWKLELPAILFLEATKPFSFIAGQGLLLCQPLLSFFYEGPGVADYAGLLSDRANVERLVARLELQREGSNRNSGSREEG